MSSCVDGGVFILTTAISLLQESLYFVEYSKDSSMAPGIDTEPVPEENKMEDVHRYNPQTSNRKKYNHNNLGLIHLFVICLELVCKSSMCFSLGGRDTICLKARSLL
ncbi:hypothetical protein C8Q69DRAFT_469673 [Paecilomyces variotii]|uniref:Uncharacterized protein n=1 Tax=Byssochlamys spectabilis TaxID=264951 RepID=A0A443HU07_BYSSP|nr:hypothetical protein C8Q69DRAFT_469673 [Paecilomyces variotii]RWQ95306.1 hypothetical protein C8Q69DRAFT_469673 [Paecilomyces variotii]